MIEIKYDDAEVQAAFQRLIHAGSNLSPALKAIGEHIAETTKQRFETATAPDGTPWAPNSPATLARKKGNKPLIGELGALSTQINAQVSGNSVTIGSPLEYAAMQQFGGKKSEFPNLWGDIPARPFLGTSDEDEVEILNIIEDHISGAMGN